MFFKKNEIDLLWFITPYLSKLYLFKKLSENDVHVDGKNQCNKENG
jgi:hypothetical protein